MAESINCSVGAQGVEAKLLTCDDPPIHPRSAENHIGKYHLPREKDLRGARNILHLQQNTTFLTHEDPIKAWFHQISHRNTGRIA